MLTLSSHGSVAPHPPTQTRTHCPHSHSEKQVERYQHNVEQLFKTRELLTGTARARTMQEHMHKAIQEHLHQASSSSSSSSSSGSSSISSSSSGSSSRSRICLIALRFQLFIAFTERKKKVPFSMAIGNGELMHEGFPKHLRMGTARMK